MIENEENYFETDGESAVNNGTKEESTLENMIHDENAMESLGELETTQDDLVDSEQDGETGFGEDNIEPSTLDSETTTRPTVQESKGRTFFRGFIRWTAGLLIIFGLGLITGIFVFYRPSLQESERIRNQSLADIQNSDEKILELEGQITALNSKVSELQPYKGKNEELLDQNISLELHVNILDARLDVANARVAIIQDNSSQAVVILDKTNKNLEKISRLLEDDQKEVVTDLMTRLGWVVEDIGIDAETALSDLNVIGAKLLQLEDSLLRK